MDRERLRRIAAPLPFGIASVGLINYLIGDVVLHQKHGGLRALGVVFVLAFAVGFVLRKISGLTWRESLWHRRERPPWQRLPTSMASVYELARGGHQIEAIKMYRELTGADIRTSRDAVDEIAGRREIA